MRELDTRTLRRNKRNSSRSSSLDSNEEKKTAIESKSFLALVSTGFYHVNGFQKYLRNGYVHTRVQVAASWHKIYL